VRDRPCSVKGGAPVSGLSISRERRIARSGASIAILAPWRAGGPDGGDRSRAAERSTSAALPGGVVAFVEAELAVLGGDARELVAAGALLGDPFDIDIAGATAALDPARARGAVQELLAVRLIVPADAESPRLLAFRHPVLRTAAHESLPATARIERHARAATVLAARGAGPPAVARHLALAAAPGDLAAARVLRDAADLVRAQGPSIAADWYLAADRADR
jgi:hypothetical protein